MEKYIIENGIKYELCGDVYYPMLKLDEQTNYQIGKYGCRRCGSDRRKNTLREKSRSKYKNRNSDQACVSWSV